MSDSLKYTKLTIADNCEAATVNDSIVTSIIQSDGPPGTLTLSTKVTINIDSSEVK